MWPRPIDLKQITGDKPLAVFEREFVVGASLTLRPSITDRRSTGARTTALSGVRRQPVLSAGDGKVEWTVHVVPSTSPIRPDPAQVEDLRRHCIWNRRETEPGVRSPVFRPAVATARRRRRCVAARRLRRCGNNRWLPEHDGLPRVRSQRRSGGRDHEGCSRAAGPLRFCCSCLIGGLAFNLTPCVLPMIPINLAIIGAGAQAQSRGRGFLLGIAPMAARWPSSMACSASSLFSPLGPLARSILRRGSISPSPRCSSCSASRCSIY